MGKEGRKEGAVPRVGETGVTFVILRQDENSQEGHCAACRGRHGGRCLDRGLLSPREEDGWVTCCACREFMSRILGKSTNDQDSLEEKRVGTAGPFVGCVHRCAQVSC